MLKCPLCQLDYSTDGEQQPRLLVGCGHTFCQKCIENLPDKDPLTCPQCSLISTDPHVPNITIMTYVDVKQASSRPPPVIHHVPAPVNVICQDCKKETATLLCFQCLPSGFKFCESCSMREHSRSFGPMERHRPQAISTVRISTPVPACARHPNQPCLFFSFKVNAFACEVCQETLDFVKDEYISIDIAVAQIREEVPALIELLQERVRIMAKTRSDLDQLLTRVDQEKNRSLERIHIEFAEFEMAMRKRMNSVLLSIEHEAKFQSKTLLQQQENLEIAQGNADTAIVRANWLLQMSDYTYIHQADSVINSMKGQLSDKDFPMYHNPWTTGEIPIYLPPDFMEQIERLGIIGGGSMPIQLKSFVRHGLLYVSWEQSDPEVTEYEISCKDCSDFLVTSGHKENPPVSMIHKGSTNEKRIDSVTIGTKYLFNVRARNLAGWGVWSHSVIGGIDGFPLEIGYTGEIVEIVLPKDGVYSIIAYGAKAADGALRKGGKGAIIGAKFSLKKHNSLIILCGGMSTTVASSSGGGGGTFVALNKRRDILLVAGGGGGTRGYEEEDLDGTDATTSESGCDGIGNQWGHGGAGGGAGKDAINVSGPSWGNGGAGFTTASTTAKSFLHGGEAGEGGGFGGGGAVGHFGGGGGGGYSGGGGGRGGGGGGSFVKEDGFEQVKEVGNGGYGLVKIDFLQELVS